MTDSLIALVRSYTEKINNGRTIEDVNEYLNDETVELSEEVYTDIPGEDGIAGEAIDVFLCALDIIFLSAPDMSDEDIINYARKKCEKWASKYG